MRFGSWWLPSRRSCSARGTPSFRELPGPRFANAVAWGPRTRTEGVTRMRPVTRAIATRPRTLSMARRTDHTRPARRAIASAIMSSVSSGVMGGATLGVNVSPRETGPVERPPAHGERPLVRSPSGTSGPSQNTGAALASCEVQTRHCLRRTCGNIRRSTQNPKTSAARAARTHTACQTMRHVVILPPPTGRVPGAPPRSRPR
jgi:hypothetical protein